MRNLFSRLFRQARFLIFFVLVPCLITGCNWVSSQSGGQSSDVSIDSAGSTTSNPIVGTAAAKAEEKSAPDEKESKALTDAEIDAKIDEHLHSEHPKLLAACRKAVRTPPPQEDIPDKKQLAELSAASCISKNSYYGIGEPADPKKALACAYQEFLNGDKQIFGGSAVLMMLYANGMGVERNPGAALHFACQNEAVASAEITARVSWLVNQMASSANPSSNTPSRPFDLCDHATSGFTVGACEDLRLEIQQGKRDRYTHTLSKSWSTGDKEAFEKLVAKKNAYFEAVTQQETDLSGSTNYARALKQKNRDERQFTNMVRRLEKGDYPSFTDAEYAAADAELNRLYRLIQSNDAFSYGTVTRDAIRDTERKWVQYVGAWKKFSARKYPDMATSAIPTWLTRQRIEQIKWFAEE